MARAVTGKGAQAGRSGSGTRSGSDQSLLSEVRWRLFRDPSQQQRMRRLERMERAAARVWVNGRPVGSDPAHGHLYETYD